MNSPVRALLATCACALASSAFAQVTVFTDSIASFGRAGGPDEIPLRTADPRAYDATTVLGPVVVTVGTASGASLPALLRQPVSTVAPASATDLQLNAAHRIGFDQYLSEGAFRPFVGVNIGRLYGDPDGQWSAGLGGGAKYYVQPRTFVQASVEYGWMFSSARATERFTDGQWTWSMGLGFTF